MKRSSWVLAVGAIACLATAYLVVAPFARDQMLQFARAWQERNDGADLAHGLVSTQSLLDYFAEHPEQVAIASWEIGDEAQGIFVNAQRLQPAPSVSSLLVLAVYAPAAASTADELVPLRAWERFWLSGTDGGAHRAALLEARARGALSETETTLSGSFAELPAPHAALDDAARLRAQDAAGASAVAGLFSQPAQHARVRDLVRAMIRYADPAAADWLIDRIGRSALRQRVRRLGFPDESVPLPFAGMRLSFAEDTPVAELLARYRVMKRREYVDATWQTFSRLRDDPVFRADSLARSERSGAQLSLREASQLIAALAPRATASAYAHLLQQIALGQLPGSDYMRAQLEWSWQLAATRHDFDVFGSLNGSQPGVYASLAYAQPAGASRTRVLALMLRDLPLGVWLHLSSSFVLRQFEADLLANDGFFTQVKQRLAGGVRANAGVNSALGLQKQRGS